MKKRVVYGEANYEGLIRKHGYFVDKTPYIETLETVENPVFLRPRRFGKSLFCRMLECYYNIRQQDQFEELFGETYIGRHPTPARNSYFVLHLDFSVIETGKSLDVMEASFNHICSGCMNMIVNIYKDWFHGEVTIERKGSASANLEEILWYIQQRDLPRLYIIIDEYDNFANQLITGHKDHLYRELTASGSFLKTFFKTLKEGRKSGLIANIFITGVLPITIDDLASGFNIATMITLESAFEQMMGFTQGEVDRLLDEVYRDYHIDPSTRQEVRELLITQYNGYHFIEPEGESLYNSTLLMYFLDKFCRSKQIPRYLIDLNLRTDLSWVKRITGSIPENTDAFVTQLATQNSIAYDEDMLTSKFNMSEFFEKDFYPISFYYLGMLTKLDQFSLKLPNLNMRKIFVEYFNELHHIDVSTQYADMMRGFVHQPDIPTLFADYWRLYVSQLPEAIFQQVNENFYRTTFYELCSRYLATWFTWNLERSYPQGKSDLDFVGKYHEQFAGMRVVIEFKYYSNTEFKKFNSSIEDFELQEEDTRQIAGYIEGLRQEYPESQISQFVIYCIGNQGFRVFEVPAISSGHQMTDLKDQAG